MNDFEPRPRTHEGSIWARAGYRILKQVDGVYWLQDEHSGKEFVALLHAKEPITDEARTVLLLRYELLPGMPAEAVFQHWRNLDARRLGSGDVDAMEVELPATCISAQPSELKFERPSGEGFRHAVALCSGELVCRN